MELIICLSTLFVFALAFLSLTLTNLVKQLKSSKDGKLLSEGKTLNFALQISTSNKKSEACDNDTDSITNRNE